MSEIKIFDLYHPDYKDLKFQQEYCYNAYLGGSNFITDKTVVKFGKEAEDAYKNRLSRAVFYPFPSKIIKKIRKFIEAKLDEIQDNYKGIESYAENIDMKGNSIEAFTLDVLVRALTVGKADVLLTAPLTDEVEFTTLKEQEDAGIREYAILLNIGQIVDWEKDRYGNYNWCIIESVHNEPRNPLSERIDPIRQRTILYKNGFEIYRLIDNNEIKVKDFTPYDAEKNLNRVPIFTLEIGESIIKDIIELSKRYMNVDSLTEDEFYRVLFDVWLFNVNSYEVEQSRHLSDDTVKLDLSNQSVFTFSNADDKPDVIRSEVKNAQLKIQYLQSLRQQISDLSGMDFVNEVEKHRVVSGESKKMDFIITNANIASFCQKATVFATELLKYCGKLLGLSDSVIDKLSCIFPTDFNVRTVKEQIEELAQLTEANADPELIKYKWIEFVTKNREGMSDEEFEQIKTAIQERPVVNTNLNFVV